MILPGAAVVVSAEDCVKVRRALMDALAFETNRNGAAPEALERVTREVFRVAEQFRAPALSRAPRGTADAVGPPARRRVPGDAATGSGQRRQLRRPQTITTAQAAAIIGVSPEYVRRLCRQRALTGARVAGRGAWMVDRVSAEVYAARRETRDR